MSEFRDQRIQKLKALFKQSSTQISSSDLGEEGWANEMAGDAEHRLAIINSSILAQLVLLSRTALKQVTVCTDMMRHLHFYGPTQFSDANDFLKAGNVTGTITKTFSDIYREGAEHSMELLDQYATYARSEDETDESLREEIVRSAEMLAELWDQAALVQDDFNLLKMRNSQGQEIYDADHKPRLKCGMASLDWMAMNTQVMGDIGVTVDQTIEYAMTMLVRMQLVQHRIMPDAGRDTNKWFQMTWKDYERVEALIGRIEAVSQMQSLRASALTL